MTTAEVMQVLRRRFWVVLLVLVGTAAVLYSVHARPGVYSSRVDVVLIAPPAATSATDASLVSSSENLIALAGLVERRVNAGVEKPAATSQEVDLAGIGIQDGVLLTLPNAGGQWNYNFTSPMLSVQAVGPDPDGVAERRDAAIADVRRALLELQQEEGVRPERRVSTRVVPAAPPVFYNRGSDLRAVATVLLIGGVLAVAGAVLVDHLLRRRRSRSVQESDEHAPVA
ncbi:hypothetical protein [Nocardioides insulae]|uniref:hypothetical protein n=1 Tax=Nocardioides insulae TaxID=394734 RepID=UPI0004916B35|nr:hypothetical protein [Nocardioides insulae]